MKIRAAGSQSYTKKRISILCEGHTIRRRIYRRARHVLTWQYIVS